MGVTVQRTEPAVAGVRTGGGVSGLVVVYTVAVLIYVVLGRLRVVPVLNPDEFIYGHLARGIADGTGFDWRGDSLRLYALLYVLLITPAWAVGSAVSALGIAKAIGALALCLVCVPVFFLARGLLGARLALLAAVLALAGTWMVTATLLMTENAALPLATAALCATVMVVRAPGSHWIWWAVLFSALAASARAQVVVLVPVILFALVADLARHGTAWRERAKAQRTALIVAGVLTGTLVVLALARSSLLTGSIYQSTRDYPLTGGSSGDTLRQAIGLVAMAGFVPFALVVPAALTRSGWRDETVAPVLAVLVPATAIFVLQAGWYMHGLGYDWAIQRYVEYVVPLALVATLAVATCWRELPRWSWAVSVATAGTLLLGGRMEWLDELGAFAGGRLAHAVGLSPWVGVAFTMTLVGLLALWLVRREGARGGGERAAFAAGGLLLVVLLAQSAVGWIWPIQQDRAWRAGFPTDLAWLDHAARGPVSRLIVTSSHPRWPTVEFFNRDVDRVYALDSADTARVQGKVCSWTIGPSGQADFDPACGPTPTRFYLDDPAAQLTFAGERTIARTPGTGRIVAVPGAPAVPKVTSLLVLPCDDRTLLDRRGKALGYGDRVCRPLMSGYFWLDAPATLVLGVRGGKRAHQATSGDRLWRIPPRVVKQIRIPLPSGSSQLELRFNGFELPLGYPAIASAALVSGRTATPIL